MKNYILISFLLSIFFIRTTLGQQLDSIQIVVPCIGAPGVTLPVSANPVDSATQYCWSTTSGGINEVLINGAITPVCTSIPSAQITFITPAYFYVICVTASSPCCTSNTSCDTIWSFPPLFFDSLNSATAIPNSTIPYGVFFGCTPTSNNVLYWSVTGDIGLNATGNSSLTTGTSNPFVNLNFGPSFTTGMLCVYLVTNFGMVSPTICMTINAATGIEDNFSSEIHPIVDYENQEIKIDLQSLLPGSYSLSLVDITGKIIQHTNIKSPSSENPFTLNISGLKNSIYLLQIRGNLKKYSEKVFILK